MQKKFLLSDKCLTKLLSHISCSKHVYMMVKKNNCIILCSFYTGVGIGIGYRKADLRYRLGLEDLSSDLRILEPIPVEQ